MRPMSIEECFNIFIQMCGVCTIDGSDIERV